MLYKDALKLANKIKKKIKSKCYIVGSLRRKEKLINDIDLLVTKNITLPYTILKNGKYYKSFLLPNNVKLDLFFIKKKHLPFALFHYTGSKKYNIRIRAYVKKKGYLLNQYGLFRNKKLVSKNIKTEKELTKLIGVSFRKPSNRLF